MGRRTTYIAEEVEFDHRVPDTAAPETHVWLTGTFRAHVEDADRPGLVAELKGLVPIADAIAWALERSDEVVIRDGDQRFYGIGAVLEEPQEDDGPPFVPWREELAATFVRRRAAAERWKDRQPTDPPIAWRVVAALAPVEDGGPSRLLDSAVDAQAAAIVAVWGPDSASDAAVLAHRRETEEAPRRAEARGEDAYFVRSCPGWLLEWGVEAPTAELAIAPLRARLVPPAGWTLQLGAEPAAPADA